MSDKYMQSLLIEIERQLEILSALLIGPEPPPSIMLRAWN